MNLATLGDPTRHFWMTRSVARAMGVSLGEAIARGHLTSDDYETMVTRCRTCQQVSRCEAWLGVQASLAETPPPGCLNADTYARAKRTA